MTIVKAEFDEETQTFRLLEPIEGLANHEHVDLIVDKPIDPKRPWLALANTLSGEDAERFTRAIDEFFPIER
jgi:hypothetical protein